jgi:hypothetical protein
MSNEQCTYELACGQCRYGILQKRAFTQAVREKVPLIINFSQIISESLASSSRTAQQWLMKYRCNSALCANVWCMSLQSLASFWASCT